MMVKKTPLYTYIGYVDYFKMLFDVAKFAKETNKRVSTLPFDCNINSSLGLCSFNPLVVWSIPVHDIQKSIKNSKYLSLIECDVFDYKTVNGRIKIKQAINSGALITDFRRS